MGKDHTLGFLWTQGQWKTGLLAACLYGVQSYGNHPGNLRATLKQSVLMPDRRTPFQVWEVTVTTKWTPFSCTPVKCSWVHETSGDGGAAGMRRWAESRHNTFTRSEAQTANKNCFVCQQERQRLQTAVGRTPKGERPTVDMQQARRLPWRDASSPGWGAVNGPYQEQTFALGFAYEAGDANA